VKDSIRQGALSGRRVLVVEDRYFTATDLEALLSAYGAEVVGPCPDVSGALALADGAHGAVLDVDLWGDRVFPVADLLADRGAPFVFVTGLPPDACPAPHRSAPWIEKPYDPLALVAALAAALDGKPTEKA
jgi:CheY-like chemotaxis protein